MGMTSNTGQSTWEQIRGGVRETERLIGQKNYNLAMVKARQTLEYMVKCLCEKYGILEPGLLEMIDALYAAGKISKTTCEHYHKIRTVGNKAIHEGDNSAYNAGQAHHLLSQEVYTFANDYNDKGSSSKTTRNAAAKASTGRLSQTGGSSRTSTRRDISGTHSGNSGTRRKRAYAGGPAFEFRSIIKPILLIIIIIMLLLIIKMIHPANDSAEESTAAITTESAAPETEATTATEEESTVYRTTDTVNVRSTPSTDTDRIGVIAPDTDIEYLRDYDDKWAVINYNGQEAYVSRDYIRQVSQ